MQKIVVRGESVYQCTVCRRKVRVPTNRKGLDVLSNCTITSNCKGALKRVSQIKEINNTPTLTPSIPGLADWVQHNTVYTHQQSVASNTWLIPHNLGGNPIIHVYINELVGSTVQLVPTSNFTSQRVDANHTSLVFSRAQSGEAQLVSLSSQNTINSLSTEIILPTTEDIQVSTDQGMLTVGTVLLDPIISLTIQFVITGKTPVDIVYDNLDNTPSIESPWAGWHFAYTNGRKYAIRSVDLTNHPNAINSFISGIIPPQGAAIYIKNINAGVPAPNDVILLGAKSPFGPTDRIYNEIVDFGKETAISANIRYSYSKVSALAASIKSVYPYIVVA
jgi:hypothetical protein